MLFWLEVIVELLCNMLGLFVTVVAIGTLRTVLDLHGYIYYLLNGQVIGVIPEL